MDFKDMKPTDGTKFIKGVAGKLGIVIAIIVVVIIGLNSFYIINEQENAVVVTLGTPEAVTTSGLHFKIPFVQQVHIVDMTINSFAIGYDLVTGESLPEESLMITSDFNFVNVDFFAEYRVTDPVQYIYASEQPEFILKNMVQSFIRDTIGLYPVDDVITTGKNQIQSEIKDKIIARLEQDNIGLQLVNITIQDAEPPTAEVIDAFKAVETAKQEADTIVNTANKYRSEQIPAAEAEADRVLQSAQGQMEARINEANGQLARYESLYAEYARFPLITKERMYYEAMESILPGLRVIIQDGSGNTLNIFDQGGIDATQYAEDEDEYEPTPTLPTPEPEEYVAQGFEEEQR